MEIQTTARPVLSSIQIVIFVLFGVLGFSACNYNDIKTFPVALAKPVAAQANRIRRLSSTTRRFAPKSSRRLA